MHTYKHNWFFIKFCIYIYIYFIYVCVYQSKDLFSNSQPVEARNMLDPLELEFFSDFEIPNIGAKKETNLGILE